MRTVLALVLALALSACGPHVKRPHAGSFEDFSVWVDDDSAGAVLVRVESNPYATSTGYAEVRPGARLVVPIGYLPSDVTITAYFIALGVTVRRNYVLGTDYQLDSSAFWVIVR